jgi:hypothetical protein
MWTKLICLILISCSLITYGVFWYRKDNPSNEQYNFKDDFKHTFLTPHWTYSDFLQSEDNHQKIAPILIILGGLVILVIGLIKIL